jgi:hypothetical protein
MDEVFPVLGGIVIGLAANMVPVRWLKVLLITVCSVTVGGIAAWVSGELAVSCAYLFVDIGQVLLAAAMTGVLANVWMRRRVRSPSH